MTRLALIFFSLIAIPLAAWGVVAALTLGCGTLGPILTAAVMGLVSAVPAPSFVARQVARRG